MDHFNCGHPKRADNITASAPGRWRCKTCVNAGQQTRYWRAKVAVEAPPSSNMEDGSHRLLSAIYREHPYVFDAADRAGRLAVRP